MNRLERLGLEVAAFQLLGSRTQAATLCALLAAGRAWMQADLTDTANVIKTRICVLRESLADVGLGGLITTAGGREKGGYALPDPGRSAVMARLIEVAA